LHAQQKLKIKFNKKAVLSQGNSAMPQLFVAEFRYKFKSSQSINQSERPIVAELLLGKVRNEKKRL